MCDGKREDKLTENEYSVADVSQMLPAYQTEFD